MNRQDRIIRTLMLEQVAEEAKARAQKLREELRADALDELAKGTVPTWRLPDIGTVSLPVSQEAVYVADEKALLEWCKATPGENVVETTERVMPWYVADLLRMVRVINGQVIVDDDEVVPGLAVRPGGVPKALSFRPSKDAQVLARAAAEKLVGDLEKALDGPVVLAENPDA